MRKIHKSTIAAVLILVLSVPAGAAGRMSPQSRGLLQIVRRFVIRVVSRISPPIGSPAPAPEEPPATTT